VKCVFAVRTMLRSLILRFAGTCRKSRLRLPRDQFQVYAVDADVRNWRRQEAEQRLNELVQRAPDDGIQLVTWNAKPAVVVLSAGDLERLSNQCSRPDFKQFLLTAPDLSLLDSSHGRDLPREVQF
jgi:prevent-host-death family protein